MTTFAITKVYTSKNGAPYTPMVGENYTLTAEFDVTGTPKNAYSVSFKLADRYNFLTMSDLTPGHKKVSTTFFLALDGTIPWEVEIDPFNLADAADPTKSVVPPFIPDLHGHGGSQIILVNRGILPKLFGTHKLSGSFVPAPPATTIDFYDPHWLIVTQGTFSSFGAGKIDRLFAMAGAPATDSWQKALSTVCRVTWGGGDDLLPISKVVGPTEYPVFVFDHKNVPTAAYSMIGQSVLEVRNQRVDAAKLRAVTWAQLDALDGINIFKAYKSPEHVIESNDKKITDFVTQTLGANYRSKFTPYDAARKLFQAVLAHMVYYYPKPGQPDLRPDTAVKTLDAGRGDCGGFSILLVALYRNIGFPARTACGAWVGQDAGHCWCEMWFPVQGAGWMVSDGSAGNGACEDGSFAYYFGSIPDLNQRYACMRGNTFTVGDHTAYWLQGPYGPLATGTASISTDSHTAVLRVDQATAMSLVHPGNPHAAMAVHAQSDLGDLAFSHCPCARHGGFSPVIRRQLAATTASAA